MLHANEHVLYRPDVVSDSGFHSRGASKCLGNSAEVIVHVMNRHCVGVVFDLLGESISETGKAAHRHSHDEVLTFDEACRNVFGVGVARDCFCFAGL